MSPSARPLACAVVAAAASFIACGAPPPAFVVVSREHAATKRVTVTNLARVDPSVERRPELDGEIRLARSVTASAPTRGLPMVVATRHTLRLLGDPTVVPMPSPEAWNEGFSADLKRDGMSITPLVDALAHAPHGRDDITIAIDAALPYRVVVEILFTCAHVGFGRYHLVVTKVAGGGYGELLVTAPPVTATSTHAQLFAALVDDGIVVRVGKDQFGPGCAAQGAGVAVPMLDGRHDFDGLRACVVAVRAATPSMTSATIAAKPSAPFSEIVGALDALRADAEGNALVPDIHFGVMR